MTALCRTGTPLRKFAPKLSKRDEILRRNKDDAHYAKLFGKAPVNQQPVPEPRKTVQHRSEKEELEGAVMQEVAEIILLSPRVVLAWRQNGGAAPAADGIFRIWFYRWVKRPIKEMVLVDFVGILKSGNMFAIECKRRDWKYTATDREESQANFMHEIIKSGGKAGFVTSAEAALEILK